MKLLIGNKWVDGFLDEALRPSTIRIKPIVWFNIDRVEGLYFIPPKSLRFVLNYIREYGLSNVIRKIRSRMGERSRNEKFISGGLGIVIEVGPKVKNFLKGQKVVFIAPCHPKCMERVVLPPELVKHFRKTLEVNPAEIIYFPDINIDTAKNFCENIKGWSPYSGEKLDKTYVNLLLEMVESLVERAVFQRKKGIVLKGNTLRIKEIEERKREPSPRKKTAVLFGYGNYAKTVIIPNLSKKIQIVRIHEIDPAQLGNKLSPRITYDTSPFPREDQEYEDVVIIAGYHHHHAPIAIWALKKGKTVILEKPIATNVRDLEILIETLKRENGKIFVGFQKRYSIFNKFVFEDLRVKLGEPVNYHAIVYEVPLPPRHWYNWPNSGGRLISNGCHWIDHFLFLNNFSKVEKRRVWKSREGTIIVFLELENGAVFTMTLTDKGSARLGLRNYVEIRAFNRTVQIIDDSKYLAEDSRGILRKVKKNRFHAYARMYKIFAQKILKGEKGEDPETIYKSGKIVIELAQEIGDVHHK